MPRSAKQETSLVATECVIASAVAKGDWWIENGRKHVVENVRDDYAKVALHTSPWHIVRRIERVASVALRIAAYRRAAEV